MNKATMFWYDLETFGLNPFTDRIAQWAGLRTDLDLNIISDPFCDYCELAPDYLPSPEACLVTKITPQKVNSEGLIEADFIRKINKEFSQPLTTVVGFNNINFDDEFIRNALYRNFYDPYEREYKNGSSRWDVLNLARAVHDLRPDGINFLHKNENGCTQFKLVYLTEDNNIMQLGAHDALVDIYATINFTKLVKTKVPKLYNYFYQNRNKNKVNAMLDIINNTPVLLTSSFFTSIFGATRPVCPITVNVSQPNLVYAFDLTQDASILLSDELDLETCPGIVKIYVNKCPYISPIEVLTKDEKVQKRLNIDISLMYKNLDIIKQNVIIKSKLARIEKSNIDNSSDIDMRIYSDGFTSTRDRLSYEILRNTHAQDKLYSKIIFDSEKAQHMIFRQVGRNWPQFLSKEDKIKWNNFVSSRLLQPIGKNLNIESYFTKLDELLNSIDISGKDKLVLIKLKEYGVKLKETYLS